MRRGLLWWLVGGWDGWMCSRGAGEGRERGGDCKHDVVL